MRIMFKVLGCSIALVSASVAAQSPAQTSGPDFGAMADDLLSADRGFAEAAANTDMITAISAMLDPKVVAPISGGKIALSKAELVAAIRGNPANLGARANWTPVKAGIAADGQQGFTLGYMTLQDQGKSEPRLSKYLAYWAKRPEGWRVIAYKREPRPAGPVSSAVLAPSLPAKSNGNASKAVKSRDDELELRQSEAAFANVSATAGMTEAFARFASPDSVNLGSAPEVTIGAVTGIQANSRMDVKVVVDGARVAASGELGFTWGTMRPPAAPGASAEPPIFPFFAVWRRDAKGQWRYAAR